MTIIFPATLSEKENPGKAQITKIFQWSIGEDILQNVSTKQTRKHSLNQLKYSFETQSNVKGTLILFMYLTYSTSWYNCLLHLLVYILVLKVSIHSIWFPHERRKVRTRGNLIGWTKFWKILSLVKVLLWINRELKLWNHRPMAVMTILRGLLTVQVLTKS